MLVLPRGGGMIEGERSGDDLPCWRASLPKTSMIESRYGEDRAPESVSRRLAQGSSEIKKKRSTQTPRRYLRKGEITGKRSRLTRLTVMKSIFSLAARRASSYPPEAVIDEPP
jgi:hypothetical protein